MIRSLMRIFCTEFRPAWGRARIELVTGDFGNALDVKQHQGHSIGRLALVDLPFARVLIHELAHVWEMDAEGEHFREFLEYTVHRFQEYGLLSRRSRFASTSIVETAVHQLAAADSPEAFAAIGNVCRTALIALGRELISDTMLAQGEELPATDNAQANLKIVARFHWGARSERQLDGIKALVGATWSTVVPFLHRQNASREEAEIAVGVTSALFDTLALLIPGA